MPPVPPRPIAALRRATSPGAARAGRAALPGVALVAACAILLVGAPDARGLVFASPESEPASERPPDFPYWDHVIQRRYEGPTVIYLGAGAFLTASHVGWGEVMMGDTILPPDFGWRHTLMNADGSGADAIVFRAPPDAALPSLPLLPLAKESPRPGDEVFLIGFGRERAKVIEWSDAERVDFGFEWSAKGRKRWGTNRVSEVDRQVAQARRLTDIFSVVFDAPRSRDETRYEAQAAHGDSGGAVFVRRDGEWLLAGMMISVSSERAHPSNASFYGDSTFILDIASYRDEILRWARPACANGADDDGDEKIDFPADPGCASQTDLDEREPVAPPTKSALAVVLILAGLVVLVGSWTHAYRRGDLR